MVAFWLSTPIPEKKRKVHGSEAALKWGLIAPAEKKIKRTNMADDQVDLTELLQGTFLVQAFVKKRLKNWPLLN